MSCWVKIRETLIGWVVKLFRSKKEVIETFVEAAADKVVDKAIDKAEEKLNDLLEGENKSKENE